MLQLFTVKRHLIVNILTSTRKLLLILPIKMNNLLVDCLDRLLSFAVTRCWCRLLGPMTIKCYESTWVLFNFPCNYTIFSFNDKLLADDCQIKLLLFVFVADCTILTMAIFTMTGTAVSWLVHWPMWWINKNLLNHPPNYFSVFYNKLLMLATLSRQQSLYYRQLPIELKLEL